MMKRIERRLLVDFRVDLRKFLVPFFDANSALPKNKKISEMHKLWNLSPGQ